MFQQFRKKPVIITAVQWTGANVDEVLGFILAHGEAYRKPGDMNILVIRTLEGELSASPNDWIIKGVKNEFYPCKPDIFEATYERVHDQMREVLNKALLEAYNAKRPG